MRPPIRKEPTARDLKTVRGLLEKAGSERELQRWIRLAMSRRKGRPPKSTPYADDDEHALMVAQALHMVGNISLHKAIAMIASRGPLRWKHGRGSSPDAMAKRLLAKAAAEDKESFEAPTEADWQGMQHWVDTLGKKEPHPAILRLKKIYEQILRLKPTDLIGEDSAS